MPSCLTNPPNTDSLTTVINSDPNSDVQTTQPTITVTIFDWDDTLLASSFLSQLGYGLESQVIDSLVERQLKELDQTVVGCLQTALRYGDVHIITNAETGWVQLSAQRFLPNVVSLLTQVKVISARSIFERMFPGYPWKWKYYSIWNNLSNLFCQADTMKNIISFGDSHVEREAVRSVTSRYPMTFCKSIKFVEQPVIDQICHQLQFVTQYFDSICKYSGDLDLQINLQAHIPENINSSQQTTPSTSTEPDLD